MRNEQIAMKTRENVVLQKSVDFAIRIVNLYKFLTENKKEFVISKQILRSGTSIGANLSEAECAMTKNDFLAKSYIAYKECSETKYWLTLLKETEFIDTKSYNSISKDCGEILKLLATITKSTEKNLLENKKKK